jgi:A/G-specific adenine glycosylase
MEFGALLCKPKNPGCGICPLRMDCFAFNHNMIGLLPVKLNKLKIKERFFNYFLYTDGERILLNKRGENDIWANMYDLPLIETKILLSAEELFAEPETMEYFGQINHFQKSFPIHKQILTHQRLYVRFIDLKDMPLKMKAGWVFTELINLKNIPLPKVIFIFLDKILNYK